MPRFMVERTFPQGLNIPLTAEGQGVCMKVVGRNAELGVTWVCSYVTRLDKITPVQVLDPYFYRPVG